MTVQIGEVVIRVPVLVEHEGGDWEAGQAAYFYVQAGKPELVSHTLDDDGQHLIALERAGGDFWMDHFPDEALTFEEKPMDPVEANDLYHRVAKVYYDSTIDDNITAEASQ
ncbi:hypothetical protein [Agromyces humi]|uniref:hypothetical protein n=1 Tax=Agromyces humi TaxID=1766800 RepID=UPI001356CB8E|nr:hypothetical protein [Agromyces humi]